jgi:hypothetical protein
MLGARSRPGEEGASVSYLKLAERSYRSGQAPDGLGYALACDTPGIRVMLGVSVGDDELPVYRIRRFAEVEPGSFRELAGYRATDPGTVYRAFRSNPDMQQMFEATSGEGVFEADGAGAGQATARAA